MHTHTRKVKLTCIGPRHQSAAACFCTCKSARVRVKMLKAARRTHSSVTARGKKFLSTRVDKYTRNVHRARWSAFMLTACLEASSLDPCLGCRAARSLPADAVCGPPASDTYACACSALRQAKQHQQRQRASVSGGSASHRPMTVGPASPGNLYESSYVHSFATFRIVAGTAGQKRRRF